MAGGAECGGGTCTGGATRAGGAMCTGGAAGAAGGATGAATCGDGITPRGVDSSMGVGRGRPTNSGGRCGGSCGVGAATGGATGAAPGGAAGGTAGGTTAGGATAVGSRSGVIAFGCGRTKPGSMPAGDALGAKPPGAAGDTIVRGVPSRSGAPGMRPKSSLLPTGTMRLVKPCGTGMGGAIAAGPRTWSAGTSRTTRWMGCERTIASLGAQVAVPGAW